MLTIVLTWLGNLLGGPFATAAVNAYRAKLASENSADKIAAELTAQKLEIDQAREALEQQTLRAEDSRWGPWVRWGFAFPFVLFNGKVIIWDRMLHWGVTDPLSPSLLQIESIIIAAYFGHSAVAIVGRAFARR